MHDQVEAIEAVAGTKRNSKKKKKNQNGHICIAYNHLYMDSQPCHREIKNQQQRKIKYTPK